MRSSDRRKLVLTVKHVGKPTCHLEVQRRRTGRKFFGSRLALLFHFQKQFSSEPSVVLSAEHMVLKQKHDAVTVWVEDVTTTSFKICLRELQNFDGLHKDIRVVSWLCWCLCVIVLL